MAHDVVGKMGGVALGIGDGGLVAQVVIGHGGDDVECAQDPEIRMLEPEFH